MAPPPLAAADDAATRPPALSQASTALPANAGSTASGPPSSPAPASSIAGIGLSAEAAAVAAAAAAAASAAAGNGTAAPCTPAPVPAVESSKGSKRQHKRTELLEAKLQVFMDHEDQRVKELTEGVLYELLPAALHVMLPSCEDPLTELDPERCRVSLLVAQYLSVALCWGANICRQACVVHNRNSSCLHMQAARHRNPAV